MATRRQSFVPRLVALENRRVPALVYRARPSGMGGSKHRPKHRPKPGYLELVIAAARQWELPDAYLDTVRHWSRARSFGTDARKIGEFR